MPGARYSSRPWEDRQWLLRWGEAQQVFCPLAECAASLSPSPEPCHNNKQLYQLCHILGPKASGLPVKSFLSLLHRLDGKGFWIPLPRILLLDVGVFGLLLICLATCTARKDFNAMLQDSKISKPCRGLWTEKELVTV